MLVARPADGRLVAHLLCGGQLLLQRCEVAGGGRDPGQQMTVILTELIVLDRERCEIAVEARDLIIEVADLRSGVVQPQVGHI